jgi:hypothetical protein
MVMTNLTTFASFTHISDRSIKPANSVSEKSSKPNQTPTAMMAMSSRICLALSIPLPIQIGIGRRDGSTVMRVSRYVAWFTSKRQILHIPSAASMKRLYVFDSQCRSRENNPTPHARGQCPLLTIFRNDSRAVPSQKFSFNSAPFSRCLMVLYVRHKLTRTTVHDSHHVPSSLPTRLKG